MPTNFSNINALVIDNNSSMRQIMVSMLRVMGMKNVIVANNEKQCLQLVTLENINLVVCGWNLPKLNALLVLEQLRNNESTSNIPFVIVSTIIEQDKIKTAIEFGVSEYLVPPFNKKIFEERIRKSLRIPIQASATNIARTLNNKRFPEKNDIDELNILIVDDIADNIEIIKEVIKDKYKVKAALNAKGALKICLSESPPDLILLDIMMPEVDGLSLCKQLKDNPLTQNIVVIFLTALTETKDVVRGLTLGAVDYITKPIVPEILLARIEVHSKIVLNQRTIQGQIDNLIQQKNVFNKYNESLYSKLTKLLVNSSESLMEFSTRASARLTQPTIEKLNYGIGMSNLLVDQFHTLTSIQQNTYQSKKTKIKMGLVILPIVNVFQSEVVSKNLESLVRIDEYVDITCDIVLLKVAFACVYNNAINSAPRGSKVSVYSETYPNFILFKLHNIAELPEEIKQENTLVSASNIYFTQDIGMNLAFLAMYTLKGELYFNSSKEDGTTFYFKIPLKTH